MQIEGRVEFLEQWAQRNRTMVFARPSFLRKVFHELVRKKPIEIGAAFGVPKTLLRCLRVSVNEKERPRFDRQLSASSLLRKRFNGHAPARFVAVHSAYDRDVGTRPACLVGFGNGGVLVAARAEYAVHLSNPRMRHYANLPELHKGRP